MFVLPIVSARDHPLTPRDIDREAVCRQGFAAFHACRISLQLTVLPSVVQHMEIYWQLLEGIPGSKLKLTKIDDEIYDHLKQEFPDFDPAATINEDSMKSKEGKERWRNFVNQYEKKVDDYNFGTMLRANAKEDYGKDTTIFGMLHVHQDTCRLDG